MQSFEYYAPTEIIFGKGAEAQTGKAVKKWGGTRVLLVYGGGSARRSGLLERIQKELDDENIFWEELGGVQPNPRLSLAEEGAKKALKIQADFILAVGGGSAIDTAKGIAHGTANPDLDLWDIWTEKVELKKSLPVGVVLTISAAGSEMSDSAVLTNEKIGRKKGLSTEFNRVKFAVMNPELTYTLPKYQVTCGIVDIMMHTLDRYFTHSKGNEMTDEIAQGLLRTVIRNGKKAFENQEDYQAMSELMWAGSISHNNLTGLGAPKDFAPHQLGHELSGRYGIAHGLANSVLLPIVLKAYGSAAWKKLAELARATGVSDSASDEAAAKEFIAYIDAMNAAMDIPETLPGIRTEDIPQLARYADHEANPLYPVPVLWGPDQLEKMYKEVQEVSTHDGNGNSSHSQTAA